MRFRRNADSRLRSLERAYQSSGTAEDLLALNFERSRIGQAPLSFSTEMMQQFLRDRTRNFNTSPATYNPIHTFDTYSHYQAQHDRYGDDPNYEVVFELLGYEIKNNILTKPSPDEYIEELADIERNARLMGWPVFYGKFRPEFLVRDRKYQVARFLGRSERSMNELDNHEKVDAVFELKNLEAIFERELDEYELQEADRFREQTHDAVERGKLKLKLYLAHPRLLQINRALGTPPNGYKMIANHIGRYETYLYYALCHRPDRTYGDEYATWYYNIQMGGYAEGNYSGNFQEAQENYLRRIFRV